MHEGISCIQSALAMNLCQVRNSLAAARSPAGQAPAPRFAPALSHLCILTLPSALVCRALRVIPAAAGKTTPARIYASFTQSAARCSSPLQVQRPEHAAHAAPQRGAHQTGQVRVAGAGGEAVGRCTFASRITSHAVRRRKATWVHVGVRRTRCMRCRCCCIIRRKNDIR